VSNVSISTNNLQIGYLPSGSSSNERLVIQSDLNFSLYEGELVCMLGPNGCGKSTLLRTLAGLQPALGGTFSLGEHGNAHTDLSKRIALVLTERLSMDNTTVHDVVSMGRYPYTSFLGGLTAEDEQIITDSLNAVGFSNSDHVGATLFNAHSDGEKQRILIAKALAQQTPIILLDEPTAHLDLPHRILVLRLLNRLAHEQNKTIVISTHELDLALALADRILLLKPDRNEKKSRYYLDKPEALRQTNAFFDAFGMDIFNPLG
jgi:iron complex transport system ATP-binding protein